MYRNVMTNRLLGMTDSRVIAGAWLEREVQGDATVFQTGVRYGHVELPVTAGELQERVDRTFPQLFDPKMRRALEYDVFRAEAQLAAALERDEGFRALEISDLREGDLPEYLIALRSGLVMHGEIPPDVEELAAEAYEPVHSVDGVPLNGSGWYDQLDAFYLPFVGFEGVARPGPTVTIYRRIGASTPSTTPTTTPRPSP